MRIACPLVWLIQRPLFHHTFTPELETYLELIYTQLDFKEEYIKKGRMYNRLTYFGYL